MLENNWEKRLGPIDKDVLNYIMHYRLRHYGYSSEKIGILDAVVMPLLILLQLSYELRFISLAYLRDRLRSREYRTIVLSAVSYVKRACLFMKHYWKATTRGKLEFTPPQVKVV